MSGVGIPSFSHNASKILKVFSLLYCGIPFIRNSHDTAEFSCCIIFARKNKSSFCMSSGTATPFDLTLRVSTSVTLSFTLLMSFLSSVSFPAVLWPSQFETHPIVYYDVNRVYEIKTEQKQKPKNNSPTLASDLDGFVIEVIVIYNVY